MGWGDNEVPGWDALYPPAAEPPGIPPAPVGAAGTTPDG
jgi:hypothetical protein